MSTRRHLRQPALASVEPSPFAPSAGSGRRRGGGLWRLGALDPSEAVALVVRERREALLAMHGHRLGRAELEDCYSQATLELLARARRPRESRKDGGRRSGGPFLGSEHIANALDQRLRSRIQDRHRALGGRSPIEAAMAGAVSLPTCEDRGSICHLLVDRRADVVQTALLRDELARIARFLRELTRDQRLLLASQIWAEQTPAAFCAQHGWSLEKYRKVGQRARTRLSVLLAGDSADSDRSAACKRAATAPAARERMNVSAAARRSDQPVGTGL